MFWYLPYTDLEIRCKSSQQIRKVLDELYAIM